MEKHQALPLRAFRRHMSNLTFHDKEFRPYISAEEVQEYVSALAKRINTDYAEKRPLFVIVLNGAFIFAADLIKSVSVDCEMAFLRVSSYRGTESTGVIEEKMSLDTPLEGRHVIIVEDIVDTGNTMQNLRADIENSGASSVAICTLLFKPEVFDKEYPIEYIGKEIPNRFVVGYGLDYNELGRNLPSIYQLND